MPFQPTLPTLNRKAFIILFLSLGYINLSAQWVEKNNGLYGANVRSFAVNGTNLFAGDNSGGGVFLSTDNGATWAPVNNGLTVSAYSKFIAGLAVSGNNIFAGTGAGVFMSSNNGTTWTQINPELTTNDIRSIAASGSNVFAGTYNSGVYRSTDNGVSWSAVNVGLTTTSIITSLAVSGSNVFAGTFSDGMFLSTNNGDSWTAINTGLTDTGIRALNIKGSTVFAGTDSGVFASSDNGSHWVAVNNGLTNLHIYSLATDDTNIFAGTNGDGIFLSTDNGATWTKVNTGLTELGIPALIINGSSVFAGTFGAGVFRSSDNGTSWSVANKGLNRAHISAMAVSGSKVFASASGGEIFMSNDNGGSWKAVNAGLAITSDILSLAISGDNLFAGTRSDGIFLSSDNGSSWSQVNSSLNIYPILFLVANGTRIFAGTAGGGIFVSNNNGGSWSAANTGLTNYYITSLGVSGNNLLAGVSGGGGIFLSNDNGLTWAPSNSGLTEMNINSLAFNGNDIFAAGNNSISYSTDNGISWSPISTGSEVANITSLSTSGRIILVGTENGLFLSYDNGANWISVNDGLSSMTIANQLVVSESDVFAGTFDFGVWSRPLVELKKNQTITFNSIPAKVFGDATFDLTSVASSSLPVSFTSSDPLVASLVGNTVTILKPGSVVITANQTGDDIYNAAPAVQQTLVIKSLQQISFAPLADKTIGDAPFDLIASSSSSLPVAFTTTSDNITISEINVTLVKAGRATITASQIGDSNYVAATSVDQSFCVNPAKPIISLNTSNPQSQILTSSDSLGNQWFLNGTAIAGATNPTMILSELGTYTVQATVDNCSSLMSDEMVATAQDQTISFGTIASKTVGDPDFQISATATSGLPVTFSTSTNKLTISGTTVTIVSAGSVTIQADQSGNLYYKVAPTVLQTFCVNPAKPIISLNASNPQSQILTSSDSLGNQWFLNGTAIAGATNPTMILSELGTYTVQATVDNCSSLMSDEMVATAQDQTISFGTIASKTVGDPDFQISATATSGLPVTFSASTNKLTISGTTATIVSAGSVTIQADQLGNLYYNAAPTIPQTFCVNPAKPIISLNASNPQSQILTSSDSLGNQWFFNDSILPGATQQVLIVTESGTYKVQAKADDCTSEFSEDQVLVVTEIIRNPNTSLTLYPNPAIDRLTIFFGDEAGNKEAFLYQLTGQQLAFLASTEKEVSFNVAEYAKGIYIAKIISGSTVRIIKFEKM